jgi:ferrochelatase
MRYAPEPPFNHDGIAKVGVLLVNLGTPDAPTPAAVRRFLAEFLWDRRVIDAPRWLWWLALHAVILRVRPARSAHAYRQIWTSDGSPLLVHSRALAERVGAALGATRAGFDASVALGMSYGSPSIRDALAQLRSAGARRLIVLPLYPQYSGTSTASAFDRVTAELQRWRRVPDLHFIAGYHDEPAYIDAVCAGIREHWRTRERAHLLFSFHGIPRRYVQAGDPYHEQCLRTARLVAARLALGEADWSTSFQSRVGREEWLRPYTDELLLQYARQGPRRLTVVCPGFAADCLETLEEIAIRNRAAFLANGGESCDYVPALNADDAHVGLLVDLIERHAGGWRAAPLEARGVQATGQRAGAAR